ncbi:hypothetical protein CXG81DRAFT_17090 [Caulochytrium protostelioides]|uniref:Epidermal growth factor receptor-like transmembrane-juxtamembrane segment domain-containing protein n=1 Tax=Caulochytrium protostelioides TaxID=1555241 RepID=A0A4P9XD09_9FUNG|nr:hypothetical protein CXG81DRAFT_17090 [Caulochytrium protostelioides]|eukprot:RKP03345.1 hypothetical protein CXG81DRAFT_17090 [Caulochytrium protostelioides]
MVLADIDVLALAISAMTPAAATRLGTMPSRRSVTAAAAALFAATAMTHAAAAPFPGDDDTSTANCNAAAQPYITLVNADLPVSFLPDVRDVKTIKGTTACGCAEACAAASASALRAGAGLTNGIATDVLDRAASNSAGCDAWTYTPELGQCWLKRLPAASGSAANTLTQFVGAGSVSAIYANTLLPDLNRTGAAIQPPSAIRNTAVTKDTCTAACQSDSRCGYITWQPRDAAAPKDGFCTLHAVFTDTPTSNLLGIRAQLATRSSATGTDSAAAGAGSASNSNTGAIIGGVIGGLLALAALCLFFIVMVRRRRQKSSRTTLMSKWHSAGGRNSRATAGSGDSASKPFGGEAFPSATHVPPAATAAATAAAAAAVRPPSPSFNQARLSSAASSPSAAMAGASVAGSAAAAAQTITESIVTRAYVPQHTDELLLRPGDAVCWSASEVYPDGWAMGMNLTTGAEGYMPLVCAGPVGREAWIRRAEESGAQTPGSNAAQDQDRQLSAAAASPAPVAASPAQPSPLQQQVYRQSSPQRPASAAGLPALSSSGDPVA